MANPSPFRSRRVAAGGLAPADNVDAQLGDGVLTVRGPKPARARPRRIEIEGG